MKVLVATRNGQGARKNDFFHATEGELVTIGSQCDGEPIDGPCGCRRSMCGFDSRKATTTFTVKERDISRDDYAAALAESFSDADFRTTAAEVADEAAELLRIASAFDTDEVLERRGNKVRVRPRVPKLHKGGA